MSILIPFQAAMSLLPQAYAPVGSTEDDAFVKWRQGTLTGLATIFGDSSRAVTDFAAISFNPVEVTIGEDHEFSSERRKAFQLGSEAARAHINQLRQRLQIHAQASADKEQNEREKEKTNATELARELLDAQAVDRLDRVFLSHKGADKAIVTEYFETLNAMGFKPWLDVEDMPAGVELNRAIHHGFTESCAAVFFITPNFRDEKYLRTEINYAIDQWHARPERFKIITLVFKDGAGLEGTVPDLLKPYVFKQPKSQLEGLREILRALPLRLGAARWL